VFTLAGGERETTQTPAKPVGSEELDPAFPPSRWRDVGDSLRCGVRVATYGGVVRRTPDATLLER
jgi:hypothetical protein